MMLRILYEGRLLNKNKPTSDQVRLIESEKKCCIALSGPGSGKTSTSIFKVFSMIAKGINPSEITVLAFTNKAINEITERMGKLKKQFGLNNLECKVCTYHSFLLSVLGVNSDEILLPHMQTKIVSHVLELSSLLRKTFTKRRALKRISALKFDVSLGKKLSSPDLELYNAYVKEQKRYKNKDFTDILTKTYSNLKGKDGESFLKNCHLVLDESQDLDVLILRIIALGSPRSLVAVGDTMQAIFNFEGNKGDFVKVFQEKYDSSCEVFNLFTNHRSIRPIVNICSLLRLGTEEFDLPELEKNCIEFITTISTSNRNKILLHLAKEHIKLKKTMFIVSRTNTEVDQLVTYFKKNSFLNFYHNSTSLCSSSEVFVTVTTLHKCKGGECDSVVITNCSEGIIPMFGKSTVKVSEKIEEEKRLFFVGVSRAKTKIYITYELSSDYISGSLCKKRRKSRFLEIIPKEYFRKMEFEDYFPEKKISFSLDVEDSEVEDWKNLFQ